MGSYKQTNYVNSLIVKGLMEDKIKDKQDLLDKLEILDGVSLSDFDTKETSDIIKKLNTIVE